MTTLDLIRKELQVGFGVQDVLDNLVHEVANSEATRVNISGLKDQLEYLNRNGMSDEDVLNHLQDANR